MLITGSCACGKVTYTSTGEPSHLDFCYCLTCQRQSGAPFMAWLGLPRASISWQGAALSTWRASIDLPDRTFNAADVTIAERSFCRTCSSPLTLQYDLYPYKTHVAAASIVHHARALPTVGVHIWCKRSPTWYQIPEDGVARYEEFDPEFQRLLSTLR